MNRVFPLPETDITAGNRPAAGEDRPNGVRTVPVLSLVFPIFNEEEVLPQLIERLDTVVRDLERNVGPTETVFVNDGSRDRSVDLLREYTATRPYMKVIAFSRNFGHQVAVTAGMRYARGQAVILLDADLQDPPELLPQMVALWREGWEVVYGLRTERQGETWFKRVTAAAFYRLLQRLTSVHIPADTGDFRLMDRKVVDALNSMGEHHRFLRGMAAWVGFRQKALPYRRDARAAGKTKYPFRKMFRLATDAICAFSTAPLKVASQLGWTIAGLSILYGLITIVRFALKDATLQPGWSSIIVILSFLSGVQLITLGFIGEYIGRIYDEVKGRPLYIVSETIGFEETAAETGAETTRKREMIDRT
ncbi:MAG: glycosyltransferase family 2 protein [Capsulimonadales bacterium]|nr:glycosyltransferase family 2 protein [Capsulimonadales bacterium]